MVSKKFMKNAILIPLWIILFNISTQSEMLFLFPKKFNMAIGKLQHQTKAAPIAVIFVPN